MDRSSRIGLRCARLSVGDRVQKTATSDQDLFDQMTTLYPD
jgi:hypothetical protein